MKRKNIIEQLNRSQLFEIKIPEEVIKALEGFCTNQLIDNNNNRQLQNFYLRFILIKNMNKKDAHLANILLLKSILELSDTLKKKVVALENVKLWLLNNYCRESWETNKKTWLSSVLKKIENWPVINHFKKHWENPPKTIIGWTNEQLQKKDKKEDRCFNVCNAALSLLEHEYCSEHVKGSLFKFDCFKVIFTRAAENVTETETASYTAFSFPQLYEAESHLQYIRNLCLFNYLNMHDELDTASNRLHHFSEISTHPTVIDYFRLNSSIEELNKEIEKFKKTSQEHSLRQKLYHLFHNTQGLTLIEKITINNESEGNFQSNFLKSFAEVLTRYKKAANSDLAKIFKSHLELQIKNVFKYACHHHDLTIICELINKLDEMQSLEKKHKLLATCYKYLKENAQELSPLPLYQYLFFHCAPKSTYHKKFISKMSYCDKELSSEVKILQSGSYQEFLNQYMHSWIAKYNSSSAKPLILFFNAIKDFITITKHFKLLLKVLEDDIFTSSTPAQKKIIYQSLLTWIQDEEKNYDSLPYMQKIYFLQCRLKVENGLGKINKQVNTSIAELMGDLFAYNCLDEINELIACYNGQKNSKDKGISNNDKLQLLEEKEGQKITLYNFAEEVALAPPCLDPARSTAPDPKTLSIYQEFQIINNKEYRFKDTVYKEIVFTLCNFVNACRLSSAGVFQKEQSYVNWGLDILKGFIHVPVVPAILSGMQFVEKKVQQQTRNAFQELGYTSAFVEQLFIHLANLILKNNNFTSDDEARNFCKKFNFVFVASVEKGLIELSAENKNDAEAAAVFCYHKVCGYWEQTNFLDVINNLNVGAPGQGAGILISKVKPIKQIPHKSPAGTGSSYGQQMQLLGPPQNPHMLGTKSPTTAIVNYKPMELASQLSFLQKQNEILAKKIEDLEAQSKKELAATTGPTTFMSHN